MNFEYDPVEIAIEELRFCKQLNIEVTGWKMGLSTYCELASAAAICVDDQQLRQGGEFRPCKSYLFGLPIYVCHEVGPWGIASIKRLTPPERPGSQPWSQPGG